MVCHGSWCTLLTVIFRKRGNCWIFLKPIIFCERGNCWIFPKPIIFRNRGNRWIFLKPIIFFFALLLSIERYKYVINTMFLDTPLSFVVNNWHVYNVVLAKLV